MDIDMFQSSGTLNGHDVFCNYVGGQLTITGLDFDTARAFVKTALTASVSKPAGWKVPSTVRGEVRAEPVGATGPMGPVTREASAVPVEAPSGPAPTPPTPAPRTYELTEFIIPARPDCPVCKFPLTNTALGFFCRNGHPITAAPLSQPAALNGKVQALSPEVEKKADAVLVAGGFMVVTDSAKAPEASEDVAPAAPGVRTVTAPLSVPEVVALEASAAVAEPPAPAKPRSTRSRRSKEAPVSESEPVIAPPAPPIVQAQPPPSLVSGRAPDVAPPASANGPQAAVVPLQPSSLSMPAPATDEIRAAFGINPGRMKATHMARLLRLAVKGGILPMTAIATGVDVAEQFYELGRVAPCGWFKANADAAKDSAPDDTPLPETDPWDLAGSEVAHAEELPVVVEKAGELVVSTIPDDVRQKLAACSRPIVAVGILREALGINTWAELMRAARAVKSECPAFERATDLEEKVRRTLDVSGITLAGM